MDTYLLGIDLARARVRERMREIEMDNYNYLLGYELHEARMRDAMRNAGAERVRHRASSGTLGRSVDQVLAAASRGVAGLASAGGRAANRIRTWLAGSDRPAPQCC